MSVRTKAVYIGLMAYIAFLYAVMAQSLLGSILVGNPLLVGMNTILAAFAVWLTGSFFITIPLSFYLDRHHADRQYHKVDAVYMRTIKLLSKLPLRKSAHMAAMLSNLGITRLCQGQFESAEHLFSQALEYASREKALKKSLATAMFTNNLAVALIRQDRLVEAELQATTALELAQQLVAKKAGREFYEALPLAAVGAVRLRLGEYPSAEEYLLKAKRIYDDAKLPLGVIELSRWQGRFVCYLALSLLYAKRNQWSQANAYFDDSMKMVSENPPVANSQAIYNLNMLANEYMNNRQFDRAEKLLELAYCLGHDCSFHPDAKQTLNYYEKLLLLTDRQDEVADMRAWLRLIPQPVPAPTT